MGGITNYGPKIEDSEAPEAELSSSASLDAPNDNSRDEKATPVEASIALPAHVAGSGTLDRLVENARDYAKASTAENTNKAYAADWKHFARLCRLKGTEPLPPTRNSAGSTSPSSWRLVMVALRCRLGRSSWARLSSRLPLISINQWEWSKKRRAT